MEEKNSKFTTSDGNDYLVQGTSQVKIQGAIAIIRNGREVASVDAIYNLSNVPDDLVEIVFQALPRRTNHYFNIDPEPPKTEVKSKSFFQKLFGKCGGE